MRPTVKSGTERLHRGPAFGVARAALLAPGPTSVPCGPFEMLWAYPIALTFVVATDPRLGGHQDPTLELAPTRFRSIQEVTLHDPRITWYRYDPNRPLRYVPLAELPGP